MFLPWMTHVSWSLPGERSLYERGSFNSLGRTHLKSPDLRVEVSRSVLQRNGAAMAKSCPSIRLRFGGCCLKLQLWKLLFSMGAVGLEVSVLGIPISVYRVAGEVQLQETVGIPSGVCLKFRHFEMDRLDMAHVRRFSFCWAEVRRNAEKFWMRSSDDRLFRAGVFEIVTFPMKAREPCF